MRLLSDATLSVRQQYKIQLNTSKHIKSFHSSVYDAKRKEAAKSVFGSDRCSGGNQTDVHA